MYKGVVELLIALLFLIPGFSLGQNGPGGVGSTDGSSLLGYWIDANRDRTGDNPVTGLLDLSGNSINNTVNGGVQFVANTLNNLGVLRFDGVGGVITTDWSINANAYPDLTVIAVYTPRVEYSGSVWGEYYAGWDGRFQTDNDVQGTITHDLIGPGYQPADDMDPANTIPGLFPTGSPVISAVIFREDLANGTEVLVNGSLATTFTSTHAPYMYGYNNLNVGAGSPTSFYFDGDIAEVIVFEEAINTAQRIIVENYMAAKYGLSLVSNDLFDEDNLGYDFDVAGIGRVDVSNIQDNSRGTGLVQILNPTDLNDNEFMFWGSDNGVLDATNFIDLPAGMQARSNRIWRVSEVNMAGTAIDVGAVDVQIDLTGLGSVVASDLRLIIDSDEDGLFNDETPISGAVDVGGNIYQFSGVSGLSNNTSFTFGTIDISQTALPVALKSFTARLTDEAIVDVDWETTSEHDNDYFVVERSNNGLEWSDLIKVDGAGNSSEELSYHIMDRKPLWGASYYRLRSVDFDGGALYSDCSVVYNNSEPSIEVYPIPANDLLNVSGQGISTLVLKDMLGNILYTSSKGGQIDISELPPNTYLLQIMSYNQVSNHLVIKN